MRRWLRSWFLSLGVVVFLLMLVSVSFLLWVLPQAVSVARLAQTQFAEGAGVSPFVLATELMKGFSAGQREHPDRLRVLVLGTDEVPGSGRTNVLTDTIMIVSFSPTENHVRLLNIPRDLYIPSRQRKINGLYDDARKLGLAAPEQTTLRAVSELTGLSFDHVVVVSGEDIASLIDVVGGVTIHVDRSFADERYPRSGVDVTTETDPRVLYESISFEAGEQQMDGQTALTFMRSRHSRDPLEGNDAARAARQQKVVAALASVLANPATIADLSRLARMYRWYADRFLAQVTPYDLGRHAAQVSLPLNTVGFTSVPLSLTEALRATDSATLLVHPPLTKYGGQWVYELADPTGKQFREFVQMNKL